MPLNQAPGKVAVERASGRLPFPVGYGHGAGSAGLAARVDELVYHHPVVVDNRYTAWFAKGEATADEVRHLTVQFSVFSLSLIHI